MVRGKNAPATPNEACIGRLNIEDVRIFFASADDNIHNNDERCVCVCVSSAVAHQASYEFIWLSATE